MSMKEKTKYLLMGIIIGAAAGIAITYLVFDMRAIGVFGRFPRGNFTGNFSNFTRPPG
jgi:hypothetical protein